MGFHVQEMSVRKPHGTPRPTWTTNTALPAKPVEADSMQFHEVANLFPMMTDTELAELRVSVKEHGVREPVLVCDGKIADGRNRWKACELEGVKCPTVNFDPKKHGASLVQYVLDRNLHRRQMTAGQRAMIATKALPMLEAEAAERKKAGKSDLGVNLPQGRAPRSSERAAATVGVSEKTVRQAKELQKKAPELAKEVAAGKITLNAAVQKSKAPDRPEPKKDGLGRPADNLKLREALAIWPKLEEIGRLIDEARRGVESFEGQPIAAHLAIQRITLDLKNAKHAILWGKPFAECPYMPNCKRGCKCCGGSQWLNKDKYNAVPADIRGAKK